VGLYALHLAHRHVSCCPVGCIPSCGAGQHQGNSGLAYMPISNPRLAWMGSDWPAFSLWCVRFGTRVCKEYCWQVKCQHAAQRQLTKQLLTNWWQCGWVCRPSTTPPASQLLSEGPKPFTWGRVDIECASWLASVPVEQHWVHGSSHCHVSHYSVCHGMLVCSRCLLAGHLC
jgi:hypothetical protein